MLILIIYGVVSNPVHSNIWIIIQNNISVFHSGLMHANTQTYALKFLLYFLKNSEKMERQFSVGGVCILSEQLIQLEKDKKFSAKVLFPVSSRRFSFQK